MNRGVAGEWVLTILLSIIAPIVVYSVATDHGVADVPALLLSGVPPLIELGIVFAIRRRVEEIGVIALLFVVVSLVVALATGDARALLLRESLVIGLFGVVLLASVPTSCPLGFLFGRRFATGGDPARVAWWNGLWRHPRFRTVQRRITAMWGTVFVAESMVRGVLAYQLPVSTMVVVNSVAPPAVVAVLVTITILWGRRERRVAEEANGAGAATPPPAQAPA